ncbi:MAG TPA: right-handed parallel beta-helix repeat-containing protein, partial [Polyangia bacterium]|nr:right-handed parallel beta-helix repeat-containing protein [Polyangia bacterium]
MKSARKLSTKVERLSLLFGLVLSLGLFAARNVLAAEYHVATTGSDSNPGTSASPFATLQKGASTAGAGDTVYIHGGTYKITTPANSGAGITISKSGTSDTNRIKFWAAQGETPVFDFSNLSISGSGYTHGIVVTGSWLHFKGLEVANVPMNSSSNCGMHVDNCSNNIFELMNFHNNKGTGVFVDHGTGGHKFINCDSHDNNDAANNGENADGFGVHYQTSGASTTFNGCRAWYNSDDGWDFISQEVPVTVENSWAMGSGKSSSGTVNGNGNGFKAGSSKSGIRHVIRNCVAWGCKAAGFYANHSSGGNDWYNNTAYNNSTQFNLLASTFAECTNVYQCNDSLRQDGVTLSGSKAHKMRNNIGFPNKNSYVDGYGVDTASNTWDLGITPAAGDFASVSDTGAIGPRQADGSLPNIDFMKLVAGSKMIDKGTDVQIPYTGSAPDLGAYEYGATGSGGS